MKVKNIAQTYRIVLEIQT